MRVITEYRLSKRETFYYRSEDLTVVGFYRSSLLISQFSFFFIPLLLSFPSPFSFSLRSFKISVGTIKLWQASCGAYKRQEQLRDRALRFLRGLIRSFLNEGTLKFVGYYPFLLLPPIIIFRDYFGSTCVCRSFYSRFVSRTTHEKRVIIIAVFRVYPLRVY